MSRIARVRTLALLMCSTTFTVVFVLLLSTTPVYASACCQSCESLDATCWSACDTQCGSNQSCLNTCYGQCDGGSNSCWSNCTYCGSGGCTYIWWWIDGSGNILDSWCV